MGRYEDETYHSLLSFAECENNILVLKYLAQFSGSTIEIKDFERIAIQAVDKDNLQAFTVCFKAAGADFRGVMCRAIEMNSLKVFKYCLRQNRHVKSTDIFKMAIAKSVTNMPFKMCYKHYRISKKLAAAYACVAAAEDRLDILRFIASKIDYDKNSLFGLMRLAVSNNQYNVLKYFMPLLDTSQRDEIWRTASKLGFWCIADLFSP